MTAVSFGSALSKGRYNFAGGAERLPIFPSRQLQWRPAAVGAQIEEIILRREKNRGVITSTTVAVCAEILVGFDVRVITARDVIWHKIDERTHVMLMNSL